MFPLKFLFDIYSTDNQAKIIMNDRTKIHKMTIGDKVFDLDYNKMELLVNGNKVSITDNVMGTKDNKPYLSINFLSESLDLQQRYLTNNNTLYIITNSKIDEINQTIKKAMEINVKNQKLSYESYEEINLNAKTNQIDDKNVNTVSEEIEIVTLNAKVKSTDNYYNMNYDLLQERTKNAKTEKDNTYNELYIVDNLTYYGNKEGFKKEELSLENNNIFEYHSCLNDFNALLNLINVDKYYSIGKSSNGNPEINVIMDYNNIKIQDFFNEIANSSDNSLLKNYLATLFILNYPDEVFQCFITIKIEIDNTTDKAIGLNLKIDKKKSLDNSTNAPTIVNYIYLKEVRNINYKATFSVELPKEVLNNIK